MGVWVAGAYTLACCEWLSKQEYQLTSVTPGIEKHDILHILKNLAPNFQNVVLAGYPSFIMDVLRELKTKNISFPKNLKIITAGDSFSEEWRDSVCKLLGPQARPESIISIYGSADAGVMGFETPFSIFIRREAEKNKIFRSKIFGKNEKTPALVQFDPEHCFVESVKGEILLTAATAIPLIRYNIQDIGKVVSFDEMKTLLSKYNLAAKSSQKGLLNWNLPFIIKEGRSDVAVTFYALNIYPEHIETALTDKKITNLVSGNFKAYNQTIKNNSRENLCLEIEMAEKKQPSKSALKKITDALIENLLKINIEFRKLHASIGDRARPKVKLFKTFSYAKPVPTKVLLGLKGKKAKIII